ncbi:MAG: hypothetical protein IJX76_07245 [Clostridia bacterium]|nr:hypothetical protein [Clostridia bacterium]
MSLAEKYLLGFENKELLDPGLVELILDAFEKNYKEISAFFNYGEIRPVTYVVDPEYDGVAATYTHIPKVIMNPRYYEKHVFDADSMTHELVHVAQNYWIEHDDEKPRKKWSEMTEEEKAEARRIHEEMMPGWLTEGLADYGRARFGVYNDKDGWKLPAYNSKQNYTDAYRVTAAFLIWAEENVTPDLAYKLNDMLKQHTYRTSESWKALTGYTVEELWQKYAEASSDVG